MNTWLGSGNVSRVIGLSKNGKCFAYQLAVKDTSNIKSGTEFITCFAFGKNATWCSKWVKKGQALNVVGKLHAISKKLDDGTYDNSTLAICVSHELVGGKKQESFASLNEKELPIPSELSKNS